MDVFAALADPVRRDLLRSVATGPVRVADLAAEHPISRPAVSKHLRLLSEAGLVEASEVGRERHYRLVPGPLDEVHALLRALQPATPPVTAEALDALDLEVRRTGRDRRARRTTPSRPSTEETA